MAITGLLVAVNVNGSVRVATDDMATALNAAPDDALISFLTAHNVHTAYAPYWIACGLTVETQQQVICTSPRWGIRITRYEPIVSGYTETTIGACDVYLPDVHHGPV